jgi:hypothetical protein
MSLRTENELEERRQQLREGMNLMLRESEQMDELMGRLTRPDPTLSPEEQRREKNRLRQIHSDLDEHRARIQRLKTELAAEYHFDKPQFLDVFNHLINQFVDLEEGNILSVEELKRRLLTTYDRLDAYAANVAIPDPYESMVIEANRPRPISLPPDWGKIFQHPDIGIPIGVPSLIAAYTGGNKTRTSLNIVRHVAQTGPVLVFSLEMTVGQLWASIIGQQLVANGGDIRSRSEILCRVRNGNRAIKETVNHLAPNIHVIDAASYNATNLVQAYDNFCNQHHGEPRLVVVDYLQMIKPLRAYESPRMMIDETVAVLTEKIKRINSGWLNVVQTNRTSEHAYGGRAPDKSAMKESGSIETDAGFAITLGKVPAQSGRRNKYDDTDQFEKDKIEIWIPKNRFGPEVRSIVPIEPVTGLVGEVPKAQMEMAM